MYFCSSLEPPSNHSWNLGFGKWVVVHVLLKSKTLQFEKNGNGTFPIDCKVSCTESCLQFPDKGVNYWQSPHKVLFEAFKASVRYSKAWSIRQILYASFWIKSEALYHHTFTRIPSSHRDALFMMYWAVQPILSWNWPNHRCDKPRAVLGWGL